VSQNTLFAKASLDGKMEKCRTTRAEWNNWRTSYHTRICDVNSFVPFRLQRAAWIDDPKTYTKPFAITKSNFKWLPEQEFDEDMRVPSDALDYVRLLADPASTGSGKQ
jgi:hypothetical protein